MKTQDLFSKRDKTLYNLNRASAFFSRAIRENAVIFDSNIASSKVTFLTESNKLYRCDFKEDSEGTISLTNFKINEFDKVLSNKVMDQYFTSQVTDLVEGISKQNFSKAGYSWENVISILEQKSEISKLSETAREKLKIITNESIKTSPAFKKLFEQKELFTKNFGEMKGNIEKVEDITNALQISEAFNKLFTIDSISDEKLIKEGFTVAPDQEHSLYEEVCRRETINSELRESKANFKKVWMTNDILKNLALANYETDEDLPELLAESIRQIPYLALVSKTELYDIFEAVNGLENTERTQNDLREYAALIFDLKKPARAMITEELKNTYGLNINAYKFFPTFENFAKVQSVLFEALGQVTKNESIKQLCEELSKDMVKKAGVGLIEISNFIHQVLVDSKVNIGVYESKLDIAGYGEAASQVILEYYGDDDTLETKKKPGKDKKDKLPFKKGNFGKDEKFNKGKEGDEEDGEEDSDNNEDGVESDNDNSDDPDKEKDETNPKAKFKKKGDKSDKKDKKDDKGEKKVNPFFKKKGKLDMKEEKEEEDLDNDLEDGDTEDEDGDEDEIAEYDPDFTPDDIQDILSDLDNEEED
jgi:hypothetical protein